jgi:DNA-directed RNA polymerase subunit M/transcription elongation factor TFIIS
MHSRCFASGNGTSIISNINPDITGYAYAREVVRLKALEAKASSTATKSERLSKLTNVTCSSCGKEAIRRTKQLRSGDEGENVVIMCPACGLEQRVG